MSTLSLSSARKGLAMIKAAITAIDDIRDMQMSSHR
ncbi:hypothetical protein EDF58_1355 [Novosphingobium sp. PhB57]|nr:hypothetical protein EDF58_1355 [Novosphingobium sp. PhB57]